MPNQPVRLKRVVVKEELVALTGDFTKAVILNQFLYWSERVRDFDLFINEEKTRAEQHGEKVTIGTTSGWIYKKAEELIEETMLGISPATMGRHIKHLIDNGWVEQRHNPNYKWDQTKQYRVNLFKIQHDLLCMGYFLEGYKIDLSALFQTPTFKMKDADFILKTRDSKMKSQDIELQNRATNLKDQTSQNERAIPEITTEIISKTSFKDFEEEESTKNGDAPPLISSSKNHAIEIFENNAPRNGLDSATVETIVKKMKATDYDFDSEVVRQTCLVTFDKLESGEVYHFPNYFIAALKEKASQSSYAKNKAKKSGEAE